MSLKISAVDDCLSSGFVKKRGLSAFLKYISVGSCLVLPSVAFGKEMKCPSPENFRDLELVFRKQPTGDKCEIITKNKEGVTYVWSSVDSYPCGSLVSSLKVYEDVINNVSEAIKKPGCGGMMEGGYPTCTYNLSKPFEGSQVIKFQLLITKCELAPKDACVFNCPVKYMVPGNLIKPLTPLAPLSPSKKK